MALVPSDHSHSAQDKGNRWRDLADSVADVPRQTTDEGDSTAEVVLARNYVYDSGSLAWVRATQAGGGGGGGDGAILDGVSAAIKATVRDYANSNPLAVVLTDSAGDYVAAGGGTEYTEDVPAATDPIGKCIIGRRRDTLAAETSADGDNVAINATNKGELYVKHVDTLPVTGAFFQATQPISAAALPLPAGAATSALQTQPGVDIGDVTVNNAAGAAAVNIQDGGNSITVDGTFFQATQPVSIAAVVPVSDNAGSLTVDAPVGTPVFVRLSDGAAAIATLPVSAASLPLPAGAATSALQTQPGVDIGDVTINNAAGAAAVNIQDGGNSITVDGTVAVSGSVAVTGPLTDAQLRATPVPVSGTVTANPATGEGKTLLFASVAQGAAGTTAIVAADATKKVKVVSYMIVLDAAGSFKFNDGTVDLSGAVPVLISGGVGLAGAPSAHIMETAAVNRPFNIVTVTGKAFGHISYYLEA
jgi:hypothetical protein